MTTDQEHAAVLHQMWASRHLGDEENDAIDDAIERAIELLEREATLEYEEMASKVDEWKSNR